MPENEVVRLMGHTSSVMVRRVYSKLAPSSLRRAIEQVERGVG